MSLIERLRPGVECAPWVIEEVKKLQASRDTYQREADKLTGELKALRDSGVELPIWTLLHRQWPDSYWYGEIYGYTEDQLRDYGDRRAMAERERLTKIDWTDVMREGSLVTWGDAATLGYRVLEAIRKGEK